MLEFSNWGHMVEEYILGGGENVGTSHFMGSEDEGSPTKDFLPVLLQAGESLDVQ